MCTAITYHSGASYFGRNLDLEYSYNETVTITPRAFPLRFRRAPEIKTHYALIGMAYVKDGYPLYYDAANEHGLAMAGLDFPKSTVYREEIEGADNITPFEFIPWVLAQCKDIAEARVLLSRINLLDCSFSDELPLSPLHWIIADKQQAITVEATLSGLKTFDNPVGVLTNNPPFDFMMSYLARFRDVSPYPSENRFAPELDLPVYCAGLGAVGLPGDFSSPARFIKAAFVKLNSVSGTGEGESVSQFFHILASVALPRGAVLLHNGKHNITVYSSCLNQSAGIYYYKTYDTHRITAVDMHRENLGGAELISYPLIKEDGILFQNR